VAVEGFVRTLRLILGLGMVAAGTVLAAPAGIQLHDWSQDLSRPAQFLAPATAPHAPTALAPGTPAVASSPAQRTVHVDGVLRSPAVMDLNHAHVLPPPPLPLPPVVAPPSHPDTGLAAAYRSTLEVPPPPLLDGQQAPPLAATWERERARPRSAPSLPAQTSVYLIRDGDDLTGIATRFYGNPAAAAVIWQANRGLLRDPGLLPIGATILLPDPNLVAGLTQVGPRSPSIEPAQGPANVRVVGQSWP
jgi:nucleoid-associated protein YgaU